MATAKIIDTTQKVIAPQSAKNKGKNKFEDPVFLWSKVEESFNKWRTAKTVDNADEYEWFNPPKDIVVVRIFQFVPDKEDLSSGMKFVDKEGEDLSLRRYSKLLPFCKVITKGKISAEYGDYQDLKVGDIVVLSDQYAGASRNDDYDKWMKEHANARPQPTVPCPPEYIGNISKLNSFLFIGNKFKDELSRSDAFTFALPLRMFSGNYKTK